MGASPVRYSVLPRASEDSVRGDLPGNQKARTMKVHGNVLLRALGIVFTIICLALSCEDREYDFAIAMFSIVLSVHAIDLFVVLGYKLLHPHTSKSGNQTRSFRLSIVVTDPRTGETTDWQPGLPLSSSFYSATRTFFDVALIICLIVLVVLVSNVWYYWSHDVAIVITVFGSLNILCHFLLLFPLFRKFFFVFGYGLENKKPLESFHQETQEQYHDDPTPEETARTAVDV